MSTATQARRDAFQRDGYFIHAESMLAPEQIARTVEAMEHVRDGVYETGVPPRESPWKPGADHTKRLVKIEMPHLANRAIFDAVTAPALGELAAAITGARRVQVFWVQQLMKPPADPGGTVQANVGWHQDRQYWKCWEDGSEVFTAWLALSDVPEEAGAMRFVPGSHRWGLLDQGDFFGQAPDEQRGAMELPAGAEWREVPVVLPAGGVSLHHNLTFHASGPNHARHTRLSFAVHLRTENSAPLPGNTDELVRYLDRPGYCPVIYER